MESSNAGLAPVDAVVMLRVVLIFQWTARGTLQDDLWKIVEMPFLPPSQSTIWLNDTDGQLGSSTVDKIEWWENHPDYYEVNLAIIDTEDEPEEFVAWMKSLGWSEGGIVGYESYG